MSTVAMSGELISINNIPTLIFTWTLLTIFSFGIGLIFMVLGNAFPETEKFLPIVLKPFYFISCIMFPLHAVPKEYWPYLLWNPIVHVVELSRESVVVGYNSDGVSLNYLALLALVSIFLGLVAYKLREEAMLTS